MLRNLIQAAAIVILLTGPAFAQKINMLPTQTPRSQEEIQRDKDIESRYRQTVDQIPDKKGTDPWGNVRPSPASGAKQTSKQRQ